MDLSKNDTLVNNEEKESDIEYKKGYNDNSTIEERDLFRDTPVRYLGYANEVGESFRALVHVNLVRLTYVIASGYVVADAASKGREAGKRSWEDGSSQTLHTTHAVCDTLLWQGLASVAIPGFTINRICALSNYILHRSSGLPGNARKWTVTAIGLAAIPFIIKPIDRSVDLLMEGTFRKWYHITKEEEKIVHHTRNS